MGPDVSRRDFLKQSAVLAGAMTAPAWAGCFEPFPASPIERFDPETDSAVSVTVAMLDGDPVQVHTGRWGNRPATLYKVRTATLEAAAEARGYNTGQFALQHPTEPEHALLAYDGVCTHLGCTVGWHATLGESADIPDYAGDGVEEGRVLCPCHQAQFDIYDLGNNLPSTPARRPLDAIRIQLVAVGDGHEIWADARYRQQNAREADQQGMGTPFALAG